MRISSGTPMAALFPIRTSAAVGNQIRDHFHNLERGAGHRSADVPGFGSVDGYDLR
jgi:hypothetical protein